MKRLVLLFSIVCCLLAACGTEPSVETDWTAPQMVHAVWESQGEADGTLLRYNYEDFLRYVADVYHIDRKAVTGGAVLYAGGVSAREVAVLRLSDEEAAKEAEAALTAYIDGRAGAFAGYAPEQSAILEQSGAVSRGAYAALLICPDQEAARAAFETCFTAAPPEEDFIPEEKPAEPPAVEEPPADEPAPEPPADPEPEPESEQEPEPVPEPEPAVEPEPEPQPEPAPSPEPAPEPWSYSRSRIVDAWSSGNREDLYQEDLEILAVLDQIPALTDSSLTAFEKELLLHDWMVQWAEYDPGALSSGPIGEPMPNNDNPYGFLTGKKGICLGYTATFQLLMELCGIECTTVRGTSHSGTADHAWNMVRLDGEWYCVDVTWDDPVASFPIPIESYTAHQYFNVTSQFLRQTDHQWDESGVPEAEGTALVWAPR